MKHLTMFALGTAAVMLATGGAYAGTLRVGPAVAEGNQVTIPILLDGDVGTGVSALNFNLNYDPALMTPITAQPGDAATAADKQVQANMAKEGEYKIIMLGMNQAPVSSGVVANVVMQVRDPAVGRAEVSITNTTFASGEGVELPSEGSSGTVLFDTAAVDETSGDAEAQSPESTELDTVEEPVSEEVDTLEAAQPLAPPPASSSEQGSESAGTQVSRSTAPGQSTLGTPSSTGRSTVGGGTPPAGTRRLAEAVRETDAVRAEIQTPGSGTSRQAARTASKPLAKANQKVTGSRAGAQTLPTARSATTPNAGATDVSAPGGSSTSTSVSPKASTERVQVAKAGTDARPSASRNPASEPSASSAEPGQPESDTAPAAANSVNEAARPSSNVRYFVLGGVVLVFAGLFLIRQKLLS